MAQAYTDKFGRPIVVVTGIGIVTSLGQGKADNWRRLTAGESGIHTITRFPLEGMRTTIAGTVDFLFDGRVPAPDLSQRLATLAAEEAIAEAGIGSKGSFPGPLFAAVPPVELEWPEKRALAEVVPNKPLVYHDLLDAAETGKFSAWHERFLFGSVADRLADHFGTQGQPISLSTACASGGTAIQLGVEAIRRGECDVALSLGTDGSVHPEALIRFSLLSALTTANDKPGEAARPFAKNRDGFVMAEGAAALVLESLEHATARGAKILGVLEGCGEMSDNFHRTRSSPDGKPIIGCMMNALKDAGITPGDVDYINAHGTSTPENDRMEYVGMKAVFGEEALAGIPISSNKSMIGHTLTAAGAIEAAVSLLTIANGRIPPTINYNIPDPAIPLDVVPNVARDATVNRVISNSFGFGGQNVCLVLTGEPA
ncbi:MAG: beta-ketoacyl-ACP synthase II [Rhizobiales bacterium 24-66-13]|uniref:beta-ketoacyl-ACP synthase n=1 Tax=Roseixanthobacter finlandensis TaxID=3119922 RepID=UPI000BD04E17|nr:MAG: beta-ketoacyl-ACP synthase II [Rhizobiales bacterium 24-66-13]OZB03195.1 MAG: beta-ketoacyl-ACP synthase II [Rhizobiales bacterium 39-66-18]HQS10575.1 beta-ketoacyl-ACP synthase [Xanthobacteraceae bacterium]HQS48953.1 beta-ketoacyl-ACP synthase [Xanthobacteraceae bacterium]